MAGITPLNVWDSRGARNTRDSCSLGSGGKDSPLPHLQPLRCPGSCAQPAAEWTWQVRGAVLFMGVSSRGSRLADDSCVRNPWALNSSTLTHLHTHLYTLLHAHFYTTLLYTLTRTHMPHEVCWNEVTGSCCWHHNKSEGSVQTRLVPLECVCVKCEAPGRNCGQWLRGGSGPSWSPTLPSGRRS